MSRNGPFALVEIAPPPLGKLVVRNERAVVIPTGGRTDPARPWLPRDRMNDFIFLKAAPVWVFFAFAENLKRGGP